jgi:PadR family transcriptional regulator PadR
MDTQIKKGIPEICVLEILSRGTSYGYKLIADLKDVFPVSESTLYPILRRLELSGALSTDGREYNGRLRKYFSITGIGIEKLNEAKRDLAELTEIYAKLFTKHPHAKNHNETNIAETKHSPVQTHEITNDAEPKHSPTHNHDETNIDEPKQSEGKGVKNDKK